MESVKRVTSIISQYTDKVCRVIANTSLLFFVGTIFGGVLLRFVFRSPNSALEDLSRTGFIWACCMGAVLAYKAAAFIRFEFLVNILPEKAKHAVRLFGEVLMLVLAVFLLVYGFILTQQVWPTWQVGAKISKGYMYMALPVSMVFMILQTFDCIAGELCALCGRKGRAV